MEKIDSMERRKSNEDRITSFEKPKKDKIRQKSLPRFAPSS